jgi:hypothetical protein
VAMAEGHVYLEGEFAYVYHTIRWDPLWASARNAEDLVRSGYNVHASVCKRGIKRSASVWHTWHTVHDRCTSVHRTPPPYHVPCVTHCASSVLCASVHRVCRASKSFLSRGTLSSAGTPPSPITTT